MLIKRGNFPSNLRLKRIYNSANIYAQYLPDEADDIRPYQGRCKGGKGKRIVVQQSMDTDDEMIAAKRAIEWVKNTELENIKTKAQQDDDAANNLSKYWEKYYAVASQEKGQERNFKRWSREEELKWSAEGYGIKNQSWSRKSVDKITATDYRNYFALLEKRSRDKNGSNGSGMKAQQKTLINKLLALAEEDFIGHSFPSFPPISKQYKQVCHLTKSEWTTLTSAVFDKTEGKELLTYTPSDYDKLPFNPRNKDNIRNWVDLFDALMLQWFFYLRAEDMYRLKTDWFKAQVDGTWVCNLETTKADRPIHQTTHYRPDISYVKRIIARKKDFEYVLFPYLPRPLNNESESHVLETLGYLLKKVIAEAIPEFPSADRKWTTIRHTAFRLTLEEFPELGQVPKINSFAANGHTSEAMLRRNYLNYIQSESVASEARKVIAATSNVRFGRKYKSKKDIQK